MKNPFEQPKMEMDNQGEALLQKPQMATIEQGDIETIEASENIRIGPDGTLTGRVKVGGKWYPFISKSHEEGGQGA
jgi:hypothetical protein